MDKINYIAFALIIGLLGLSLVQYSGITGMSISDTGAPVISVTKNISSDSAIISWTTDEPSNCTFYSDVVSSDLSVDQSFSIELTGLNPGTEYIFDIAACDNVSNCALEQDSFTTTVDDTASPVVSVSVSTSVDSATIEWNTNEQANSTLTFDGSDFYYDYGVSFSKLLTGLDPGTGYSYSVAVCDVYQNCGSNDYSFTTGQDSNAPDISVSESKTSNSATITWTTDESANSTFTFDSEDTEYGFDTSFSKILNGLSAETDYDYTIKSCDQNKNCDTEIGDFTTNSVGFELDVESKSTSYDTANISWTTSESATSKFHYSNVLITYPDEETSFAANIEELIENATYIFNVSACSDTECVYKLDNFTTLSNVDTQAPDLTISVSPSLNSAAISWTTDETANSTLTFDGNDYNYGYATSFSRTLNDLSASTSYNIEIEACDPAGNCNTKSKSFTTTAVQDSTAPNIAIGDIKVSADNVVVEWSTNEMASCDFIIPGKDKHFGLDTRFSYQIDSLEAARTYDFEIKACDEANNCKTTTGSFTTESPTQMAAEVQGQTGESQQDFKVSSKDDESTGLGIQQPDIEATGAVTGEPGIFNKIKRFSTDNILIMIFTLILTITFVFNISYVVYTKAAAPYNNTIKLINTANQLIRNKQHRKAAQLYPRIMQMYKKASSSDKKDLYKKIQFLYLNLQLHSTVENAETLTERYYSGQLDDAYIPQLMKNLDSIEPLLAQLRQYLPQEHHVKYVNHFMHRHNNCLAKVVERRSSK